MISYVVAAVGVTIHPRLSGPGVSKAASASCTASVLLPHRTPQASTRRDAVDWCTAPWPLWGLYPTLAKRAALLMVAIAYATSGGRTESVLMVHT
jgi:hypothetical protein